MTVGPLSRWREDTARRWLHELMVPGLAVVLFAALLGTSGDEGYNVWIALAVLLSGWVSLGVLRDLWHRVASGDGRLRWHRLNASFLGMATAHLGFAAVVLGAVVVTQLSEERDLRMAVGDIELLAATVLSWLRLVKVRGRITPRTLRFLTSPRQVSTSPCWRPRSAAILRALKL